MAIVIQDKNGKFIGLSGKVGDAVYRYYKDTKRSVKCKLPRKTKSKPTVAQKNHRKLFAEASRHAKNVMRDPVKSAEILAKLKFPHTNFSAALAEYMLVKKQLSASQVRPAKKVTIEKRLPIGMKVKTGKVAPESGVWKVKGATSKTAPIAKGNRMPPYQGKAVTWVLIQYA